MSTSTAVSIENQQNEIPSTLNTCSDPITSPNVSQFIKNMCQTTERTPLLPTVTPDFDSDSDERQYSIHE